MKKLLLILSIIIMSAATALANNDKTEVLNTFDKYVNDANSYSENLANYYINNAKIVRVVNRKQGGQKIVVIPFDRYVKELKQHAALAKTVKYKNTYTNKKVEKINKDYKVSAKRIPRNDKTGLDCYFIFTKTNSGWKIKEESMTTNVQTFLNAK